MNESKQIQYRPKASIDSITPQRHLINLDSPTTERDFGFEDYVVSFVFDDIVLVEYVDEGSDGASILRNGIYVPVNATTKAWRKAQVILTGPEVKYAKVGDVVVFPNDKGIPVSNIDVMSGDEKRKVRRGIFLNESRLFGICQSK